MYFFLFQFCDILTSNQREWHARYRELMVVFVVYFHNGILDHADDSQTPELRFYTVPARRHSFAGAVFVKTVFANTERIRASIRFLKVIFT